MPAADSTAPRQIWLSFHVWRLQHQEHPFNSGPYNCTHLQQLILILKSVTQSAVSAASDQGGSTTPAKIVASSAGSRAAAVLKDDHLSGESGISCLA